MNKENISDALDYIDGAMISAASEASPKKRKPVKIGIVAASLAAVLCATSAVAAVGGHFVNVKNIFGTVTGTRYEDASDDLSIKFAGFKDGRVDVDFDITNPDAEPYREIQNGAKLDLLSYTVTDSDGKVVIKSDGSEAYSTAMTYKYVGEIEADSNGTVVSYEVEGDVTPDVDTVWVTLDGSDPEAGDGVVKFRINAENLEKTGEQSYTVVTPSDGETQEIEIEYLEGYRDVVTGDMLYLIESRDSLREGVYTLDVDKLVMNSKGDQPLEITGSWQTEFEIGSDVGELFA